MTVKIVKDLLWQFKKKKIGCLYKASLILN